MHSVKPSVLIADDEDTVRLFLKMVIRPLGLDLVGEARNGQEAVEEYRKLKPDLVLMDFNMPVKNGDEALRELMQEFPSAKVIMLTSVADMETVKNCLQHGATNYIRKDMPVDQVRKILKSVIEKLKPA